MKTVNTQFGVLPKSKLSIDSNDMWSDLVTVYKGVFDPHCQLRVSLKGQHAIDTGGVRRQVYTQVFQDFADNKVVELFEGSDNHLRPVVSAVSRSSGLLHILGKMIAHSICQEGIGFPYLTPTCYWYIIGGEDVCKTYHLT